MEKQVNTDIYLYIIITRIKKRFPVESVRCRDGSGINVHKKGKGGTNPTYHPHIISCKFYLAGVLAAAAYVWIFIASCLSRYLAHAWVQAGLSN